MWWERGEPSEGDGLEQRTYNMQHIIIIIIIYY
jgi:hypothetical protein